jgi:hypothetical protein
MVKIKRLALFRGDAWNIWEDYHEPFLEAHFKDQIITLFL